MFKPEKASVSVNYRNSSSVGKLWNQQELNTGNRETL